MDDKLEQLRKDILRKISHRNAAIEALGFEGGNSKDVNNNPVIDMIDKELSDAALYSVQTGYWILDTEGSKSVFSSIKVFVKKLIRKVLNKLLGWYIVPIYEKQNSYNCKIINTLDLMKEVIANLQENDMKKSEMIIKQENIINEQNRKLEINNKYILDKLNISCDIELLKNAPEIDYFQFENEFRGSREWIKSSQSNYVNYFKTNNGHDILDIGCGRGEFLELMSENGIPAIGIDSYEPFVKYCKENGFRVQQGDALTFLNSLEDSSLGGIFMAHVVEHISNDYTLALINTAYKKLITGAYFILETPNPETLYVYKDFYVDMGHLKPVHFRALEYCFKQANYESVERFNNEFSKHPLESKHIISSEIENVGEFNKWVDTVSDVIFGYRDYTLIAKK
jgi:O-antigen chain-terminating methyltransferase